MRVIVRSIEVELHREDTFEVITIQVSPSLDVKSAFNEYGMAVELTAKERRAVALRIRKRILANELPTGD